MIDPESVRRRQRMAEAVVEDDLPPKRRETTTDSRGRRSEFVFRSEAERRELERAAEHARKATRNDRVQKPY